MGFKIGSIKINNFFGFKETEFSNLKGYNVLIGKNNVGKSNFFKLLNALISNFKSGTFDNAILYDSNSSERAEITFEYELDIPYRIEFFNNLQESDYFSNAFNVSNRKIDNSPVIWNEATLDWLAQNDYFKKFSIMFSYEPILKGIILKSIIASNKDTYTKVFNTNLKEREVTLEFLDRDGLTGARTLKEFFKKSVSTEKLNFWPYPNSLRGFHQLFMSDNYKLNKKNISDYLPFYRIYFEMIYPFFNSFLYIPHNRHFEKANDISSLESTIPSPDGTNIGKFLANMKMNNAEWLDEFNSELIKFFLNIDEFSSRSESDQTIFHSKEKGLSEILRLDNLGTGQLNIVNLLINLKFYDKEKFFFLIEEPELFIFPGLQKNVREKLINFSSKNQVFITSHSPNFLSRDFNKCSIYNIRKKKTYSIIDRISDDTLKNIFRELELTFYDYVLYDGFLFVEGPKDNKVFNIIIDEMFEKSFKIIPTEGKNNFVHYASANIIHFLDNNSFSFLFILDRDRGNENFYKRIKKQEDRELVQERIVTLFTYEIENIFLQPILILDYLYTNQKIKNFSEDCEWLLVTLENIFQLLGYNNFDYLVKKINDNIVPKLSNAETEDLIGKSDKFTNSTEVFDFWYETINEMLKNKLIFLKTPTLDKQFFYKELKNCQDQYEELYNQKEYNLIISGKKIIKILSKMIIQKYELKEFTLEMLTKNLVCFLHDFFKYLGKFSNGDKPANTIEFQTIIKLKEKDHNLLSYMNSNILSKLSDYLSNFMALIDKISRKMESKVKFKFTLSKIYGLQYILSFLSLRWNLNELL